MFLHIFRKKEKIKRVDKTVKYDFKRNFLMEEI